MLARALLARDDAERLLDALDQEYAENQRLAVGRARADAWYRRQVLLSIGPLRAGARRRARQHVGRVGGRGSGDGLVPASDRRSSAADRAVMWQPFDGLLRDVAWGLRQVMRHPMYSAIAVLTLAFGIGANAALFSVVHSVLLAPFPYDSPERIYRAWAHADDGSIRDFSFRVSELRALAARDGVFDAVGAEFPTDATVLIPGQEPLQIPARMVSAGFFEVFGVHPAHGRMFKASEIEGGQALVAVTSYGFAERHLGGVESAVGQSLPLGSGVYTVVGVLPRDYEHVSDAAVELFVPYTIGTSGWIAHWLDLYVRLRPTVPAARATDEINTVLRQVGAIEERSRGWHATVEPLHEMISADVRTAVLSVFGTAALVLLIACVNVAILALARALTRRGEIGLRTALGAGRGRLVRQLLVENLTLFILGGVAGTLVAWGGVRLLVTTAPASVPRIEDASLDSTVLVFALAVTLATGLAFGLFPAFGASSPHAMGLVGGRGTTTGRRAGRLFGGLITAQVALAVTLLIGAALLIEGYRTLLSEDMGFDRGGTLAFRTVVPRARYPTGAHTYMFYDRLRSELLGLPGVTAVGAGTDLPVSGDGAIAGVTTEARLDAGFKEAVTVLQRRATEGFFDAMGTRVIEGRGFDSRDRSDSAPVVVISASLAKVLFPGESAVGRRVLWGATPASDDWVTVIGVAADVRYLGPDVDQHPQIYQAHSQSAVREMAVVVRAASDPAALIEPARTILRRMDAQIPMYSVTTLRDLVDRAVASRRFTMWLFGVFAMLALALTASGLFGVLTFAVQQRRREIGVRIALGAEPDRVTGLVVGRSLAMIGAGLVIGIPGAALAFRLLDSLLYRVSPLDPSAYAAGIGLLTTVAVLAAYLPARAAAAIQPMTVLREE
jgi:predicted permease